MRLLQIITILHGVVHDTKTYLVVGEDTAFIETVEQEFLRTAENFLGQTQVSLNRETYLEDGHAEFFEGSVCLHWPNVSINLSLTNHEA